jgi:hypothetical protein
MWIEPKRRPRRCSRSKPEKGGSERGELPIFKDRAGGTPSSRQTRVTEVELRYWALGCLFGFLVKWTSGVGTKEALFFTCAFGAQASLHLSVRFSLCRLLRGVCGLPAGVRQGGGQRGSSPDTGEPLHGCRRAAFSDPGTESRDSNDMQ